jgi:hypothetical protein
VLGFLGMRIARHNAIATKLVTILERWGYTVYREPCIKTNAGLRKPDLVVSRSGLTWVVDVTIVSDNAVLDTEHERKVTYYDVGEIREFAAHLTGVTPEDVSFSALVLNWRGAMARRSHAWLTSLGLSTVECQVLSVATLEHGYQLYLNSTRSTMRERGVVNPTARFSGTHIACKPRGQRPNQQGGSTTDHG